MNNLEYIDNFFSDTLTPAEKEQFQERLRQDPAFAEDFAFYISSKEAGRELAMEKRQTSFESIYTAYKSNSQRPGKILRLNNWRIWAAAAAVVAAVIFSWSIWTKSASPQQLAASYTTEKFETLPVTMGNNDNDLQRALRLYNNGNREEALRQFEQLAMNQDFFEAKKYAGIVSLQLKQYDKAIGYFSALEKYPGLYSNPGTFYHAIALMKRNLPGDNLEAKQLLQQVDTEHLEGDDIARQWLKKW